MRCLLVRGGDPVRLFPLLDPRPVAHDGLFRSLTGPARGLGRVGGFYPFRAPTPGNPRGTLRFAAENHLRNILATSHLADGLFWVPKFETGLPAA